MFACERESYHRIVSLCDARLAHDCSFFFDFTPCRCEGSGVLDAFRTDRGCGSTRPPAAGLRRQDPLNLAFAIANRQITSVDLGHLGTPLRGYANVEESGTAIIAAALEFAVADGRLDQQGRLRWEQWARRRLDEIVAGYEVID